MAAMDLLSDYLTRIRNASKAGQDKVTVLSSKMMLRITEILKQEGFIDNFKVIEEGRKKFIRIHLKYENKKPTIQALKRISKQSIRHYVGSTEIPKVLGGMGIAILSTSRG